MYDSPRGTSDYRLSDFPMSVVTWLMLLLITAFIDFYVLSRINDFKIVNCKSLCYSEYYYLLFTFVVWEKYHTLTKCLVILIMMYLLSCNNASETPIRLVRRTKYVHQLPNFLDHVFIS